MRTVNISELKAHLSAHIQYVQHGEEVLVCDRNRPVARIVPCKVDDYSEQIRRLIARGVISPPKRKNRRPLPKPAGKIVPNDVMRQVWREERGD